jgi:hypothetical protein
MIVRDTNLGKDGRSISLYPFLVLHYDYELYPFLSYDYASNLGEKFLLLYISNDWKIERERERERGERERENYNKRSDKST